MRWPRTLTFYVTREVLAYTLLGLVAITIVMVSRSLMRVLDELVGAGFLIEDLLTVLRLLGTMLATYALPVSFLFGVLLALGRMAADVEITAMRACGIGLRGLMLPIGLLGLLLSLGTLELMLDVEPAARRGMSEALRRMLLRGATVEAGSFSSVGDRTLYVDERDPEGRLSGIVISDRSDPERPFVVFAESGAMELDEERAELTLHLESGNLHLDPDSPEELRSQRIGFERFEYTIDVAEAMGRDRLLRARAMDLAQLREIVGKLEAGEDPGPLREDPAYYATQLQRRYARPAAPLLFALVGVPLGLRRKRGARSAGVILSAVLAFAYYALQSFCELLAEEQGFPPSILWLPNLAFAALGLALLARARRSI